MTERPKRNTVMALGFFDGVHLGHAQLINTAKARAVQLGAQCAVLSFDRSPMEVVTGEAVPLIGSTKIREETIRRYFGDVWVYIHRFDEIVMATPWRAFLDELIERHDAVYFVIGHDFSCGHRGEGTAPKIAEYCAERGLGCDIIPEFKLDGITVSSTYIKGLIAEGDFKNANRFLGHPYCVSGKVEGGRKVGRRLGTPTINLPLEPEMTPPAYGVYATRVCFDGAEMPAVTNVGVRPTLGGDNAVTVESFILDFEGDLYGKSVTVDFYDFLRPERRFANLNELRAQILCDAESAGRILSE